MSFHILGKNELVFQRAICTQKNKVLYMKVIISYEWKLSYKSSPYIACKLKHLLLVLNNGQIMSCIFQRQCLHDIQNSLYKATQEKPFKLRYRIHSFGKNYFKTLMYTHNTKFQCKKVGAKYEQNIPIRGFCSS